MFSEQIKFNNYKLMKIKTIYMNKMNRCLSIKKYWLDPKVNWYKIGAEQMRIISRNIKLDAKFVEAEINWFMFCLLLPINSKDINKPVSMHFSPSFLSKLFLFASQFFYIFLLFLIVSIFKISFFYSLPLPNIK